MRKDKDAQVTIRNLNKLSEKEREILVKWLKSVLAQIEVREEAYSSDIWCDCYGRVRTSSNRGKRRSIF